MMIHWVTHHDHSGSHSHNGKPREASRIAKKNLLNSSASTCVGSQELVDIEWHGGRRSMRYSRLVSDGVVAVPRTRSLSEDGMVSPRSLNGMARLSNVTTNEEEEARECLSPLPMVCRRTGMSPGI